MVTLAAQARTVARGEKNPHVGFEDPIENRAWAVWFAVRKGKVQSAGKASKGPQDRGLGDTSGWLVEVNMTTKMRDLWVELAQADQQSRNNFISEVRQFLTRSGNAVCTRLPGVGTGDHGQPEWWIRDEWLDVKGLPLFRPTELTSREKRLTAEEAGEDREPQPVTVTTKQEAEVAVAEESADAQAEGKPDRSAQVLEILAAASEPMYQSEITQLMKVHTQEVGRTLRLLREAEKIAVRVETTAERPEDMNGRYRFLYWLTAPVPERKTPLVTNSQLDRINVLKEGESLSTNSFSPATVRQIDIWVKDGLLEYVNKGAADERIQIASGEPAAKVKPLAPKVGPRPAPVPDKSEKKLPAPVIPPVAPKLAPAPAKVETEFKVATVRIDSGVAAIADSIEKLVRERVISEMNDLLEKTERDSALVQEYKTRAERAESALIDARAELSAVNQRLAKARELFGV